ncbi:putative nucleic acid-binding protein [Nocardiopsis mwathae]|uniref:Putative nucleic acid-binding protein n=1 Tax=Nocardiopsis mwathae TaxID=1472723 RepID=A0A7W9YFD9_9ACTN|nr:PIN domain nuclease [Nocardiopsis mwathae]MBB6171158.1 putative nucleic acid-binding protein [Nocardiopsis mwathae]
MQTIVYDTGALIAAERGSSRMLSLHRELIKAHVYPTVPVVVLAQAWRGGPQAMMSRLLNGCEVVPDGELIGRSAGAACRAAGTSDVVDAIVVMTAIQKQSSVVTSDPDDLRAISDSINVKLPMYVI